MDNTQNKRKIARTEKDKSKLYQEIIDIGRELFTSRGSHGFSTRELAARLNMTQPNLYNYVKSKRELWVAIRIQDYENLVYQMESLINEHQGNHVDLFEKMVIFFLDFVKNDYKRYQMLFLIPPPRSKKRGPLEKGYKLVNPLNIIKDVVRKAMEAGEIKEEDVDYFTYYFFGLTYGMAYIENEFRFRTPITEPIENNLSPEKIESFRKYILERLRNQLKS